jgi:uncharacterized cysteine cluster protein YcgN (CxxCxxCC family)
MVAKIMITMPNQFWKTKSLADMTPVEWESLCDNCGRCCLQKIGDGDSGKIKFLAISCEYLDISTCRCLVYENRKRLKPDCVKLSPEKLTQAMGWLPDTCAYRNLAEGKELNWWHPLVSGDPNTVHKAEISVRNKVTPGGYLKLETIDKILL